MDAGLFVYAAAADVNAPSSAAEVIVFVDADDNALKMKKSDGTLWNAEIAAAPVVFAVDVP